MIFYPIICPQIKFIDKYGNNNAFCETNPSLFIHDNGEFIILVRLVNYNKFHDRSFTMGESRSITKYYILKGIFNNFNNFNKCDLIELKTSLQTYKTYWYGIEDIRFIDNENIIGIMPEINTSGNPCIVKGTLKNNTIEVINKCEPSNIEKNWMPFIHNNKTYVIYSLYPFIIKELDTNEYIKLNDNPLLSGYNGSTNGIKLNNHYLFIVHNSSGKSIHKWLLLSFDLNTYKISEPFTFFEHSYIEFTCSLSIYNNKLFIGLGVNDNKAFIVETDIPIL